MGEVFPILGFSFVLGLFCILCLLSWLFVGVFVANFAASWFYVELDDGRHHLSGLSFFLTILFTYIDMVIRKLRRF